MAHLIRIVAGVAATALVIALGFAFWPQFDKSLASSRAAVEKPTFVTPPTPAKTASAAPAAQAPQQNAAALLETDPNALTKLAMAIRANGSPGQPAATTPELGATRGLSLAPSNAPGAASEEARRLCAQGLVALAQGSVASARAYLQRAADGGDARALLALGATYDPATLARIGARGIKGDAARAREYYSQALAAGVSDARERMAAVSSP